MKFDGKLGEKMLLDPVMNSQKISLERSCCSHLNSVSDDDATQDKYL